MAVTPGVSPRHVRASTELPCHTQGELFAPCSHSCSFPTLIAQKSTPGIAWKRRCIDGAQELRWKHQLEAALPACCSILLLLPHWAACPCPCPYPCPRPCPCSYPRSTWGHHTTVLFPLPRSVPQASKHHVLLHPLVQAFLQGAQRGLSAQHVAQHLLGTALGHRGNAVP